MGTTNREALRTMIDEVNSGGGMPSSEQMNTLLLMSIANSLATIADALTDEKAESEVSEELSENTFNVKNSCPNRCIDCKYFDERSNYVDDSINVSACTVGSCKKRERNFVSSDPYNQVPSWCPLKGEKNE